MMNNHLGFKSLCAVPGSNNGGVCVCVLDGEEQRLSDIGAGWSSESSRVADNGC